ncbi:ATP-binding protein [Ruminococcus sp. OA3]|uniref:ATP-binding protein n=1 Tax=Ruminococcus sp. OA3 TaxID=2914164 RepID=UPI001F069D0E|nr:ATP-binding protein [Ruminococcus sp. OA3]MCH1984574.1 ATP-binding protein [Ruminococcus sp. OA3]
MAIPVLIIGRSGTGKSRSIKSCVGKDVNLIRVLNKPLPFRGKIDGWFTDDYQQVMKCLLASRAKSIVIDDAGYLITNHFMRCHANTGGGNGVFSLYNDLGDYYWNLIQFTINKLPGDKIVYFIMHEDKNEAGDVRPKTIGKMLDEKVCIEGMFTIVLRSVKEGDDYLFVTQALDGAVSKSPEEMFESVKIPNDLWLVDQAIRNYYEMEELQNAETK